MAKDSSGPLLVPIIFRDDSDPSQILLPRHKGAHGKHCFSICERQTHHEKAYQGLLRVAEEWTGLQPPDITELPVDIIYPQVDREQYCLGLLKCFPATRVRQDCFWLNLNLFLETNGHQGFRLPDDSSLPSRIQKAMTDLIREHLTVL